LAQNFVYFIEDLIVNDIDTGRWEPVKKHFLRECPSCKFAIECPSVSDKNECVAVLHSLPERLRPSLADEDVAIASQQMTSISNFVQKKKLENPDYDTIDAIMPWETGEQPLAFCPSEGQSALPRRCEADTSLHQAISIFCRAGIDSMVEFYVDPRFKGNYERLKGPDGWIEKAFLTYMGSQSNTTDNISAQEDLLVQSVHHFSKHPVVLTNFGIRVPKHMTPERFPNLVLMHARSSATSIKKGFNLNKLISMLFTKVKGGVVLDADQWVNRGIDMMMERAFEETTKEYPYPVLPVHWMSRDPESDDMAHLPPDYAFTFKSKEAPVRTMRWGHAHPTWTHYALPWLASWTSYVLSPDNTACPVFLKEEGFVDDEPLLNFASWAHNLTKQWCKFDIPNPSDFVRYLDQRDATTGIDSKYFPKGIPLMFLTAHDAKHPQKSFDWLAQLWDGGDDDRKTIFYDGRWFGSAKALKFYDPSLKCIV